MNHKEIMEAFLNKTYLKSERAKKDWGTIFFRLDTEGFIVDNKDRVCEDIFDYDDLKICLEPKKKKKITFYEYIDHLSPKANYLSWCSNKEYIDSKEYTKLTGKTREIEIDEKK